MNQSIQNAEQLVQAPQEDSQPQKPVFTPLQVRLASFIGGPLPAVFFLRSNYVTLGNTGRAKQTVMYGLAFCIVLLLIVPFLPAKFPRMVIPLAYSITAGLIAENTQLSKQAIRDSPDYCFGSSWKVTWVSLLGLLLFFVLIIAVVLAFSTLGLVRMA